MPRLLRLPAIPFGWYYVALYAETGRNLVTNAADLKMFLRLLRATLNQNGAHLHAACVTPNGAHLAIQSGERPVTVITRSFCHDYAWRFNRQHHQSGLLFRSHPHVLLIQHSKWLVPLVHVIHWIPRLRSQQSAAADCSWSSDAVYRRHARRNGLITHVVFHILAPGVRRREVQDEAYRRRFNDPPNTEHWHLLAQGSPDDSRMLGDAEFLAGMWRTTHQESPRHSGIVSFIDDIRQVVVNAVEKLAAICDGAFPRRRARAWKRVVTLERLCSHSRRRPLPMIRAVIASNVIERHAASRVQTAHFFGCHPETLSARRRRHYEEVFRELFGFTPEILFSPTPGNRDVERRNENNEKDREHAGRSERAELCCCPG